MHKFSRVEITFPTPVALPREFDRLLSKALEKVCREWERENPGHIMWEFGNGFKMLVHPMMINDDEPIPLDESAYHIEVTSREAYEGERNYVKTGNC